MEEDQKWKCAVCDMNFQYSSKLERHKNTKKHKLLDAIINPSQGSTKSDETHMELNNQAWSDCSRADLQDESELLGCDNYSSDDFSHTEVESDADDSNNGEDDDDFSNDMSQCSSSTECDDFYPFDSKEAALLYILINNPLPVSERILKYIFHTMKEIDPFIPSLNQVKSIELPGYISPTKCTTTSGIPFYVNLPSTILQRCLSSIDTARELHHYPTLIEDDCICSEFYEAQRWYSDSRFEAPMARLHDGTRVFIGDIVTISDQCYGKVTKFFMKKSSSSLMMHVQCITAHSPSGNVGECYLLNNGVATYPVSVIKEVHDVIPFTKDNMKVTDSTDTTAIPISTSDWDALEMRSKWKKVSREHSVLLVPIVLFSDDVSGNVSKKWNKFDVWAMLLAGLPKSVNSQLENIHLICASNAVDCLKLADPIVDDLLVLENEGVFMYDASYEEDVLVVAPVLCAIADNPRASDLLNHAGTSARMFCRMCMVDGQVNPDRVASYRTKDQMKRQMMQIASAATAREKRELKTLYGIKEADNPLLRLPLDLCQSTPVECLHTILLGSYKYLFSDLMERLSSEHKNTVSAHIVAFPTSGLDLKLSKSACRYYQSFNGKDFKALAQMAPFILWEVLNDDQKSVWLSLSKIFRITYCKPFRPKDVPEVELLCKEFVKNVKKYKPSLLTKPKVHLLLHLPTNMKDFGPASCFNTERCEAFNKLVKKGNIHSNKQAPSRDIASKFSKLEHLRLMCSSGRCGRGVSRLLEDSHVCSFLHGTTLTSLSINKKLNCPGELRKERGQTTILGNITIKDHHEQERSIFKLRSSEGFNWCSELSLSTKGNIYGAVVAQNGTLINTDDHVAFSDGESIEPRYGELKTCVKIGNDAAFCIVQLFYNVVSNNDEKVYNEQDCPLLMKSSQLLGISANWILSPVSIVHECLSCSVEMKRKRQRIEREEIDTQTLVLKHDFKNNLFALNIYCMHTLTF